MFEQVALVEAKRELDDLEHERARSSYGTAGGTTLGRPERAGDGGSGAAGTSLVAAGRRFGIPLSGTMAHSFVMSYDDERDAFRAYARTFPSSVVLLIDTYDTVEGARRAAEVAREVAADGIAIDGVRLDSGDLGALAREVRRGAGGAGAPRRRALPLRRPRRDRRPPAVRRRNLPERQLVNEQLEWWTIGSLVDVEIRPTHRVHAHAGSAIVRARKP